MKSFKEYTKIAKESQSKADEIHYTVINLERLKKPMSIPIKSNNVMIEVKNV